MNFPSKATLTWAAVAPSLVVFTFLASAGISAQLSRTSRPQSVAIDLRGDYGGAAALHAFSLGAPYTIDPHALHFIARAYGSAHSVEQEIGADIGPPVLVPPEDGSPPDSHHLREYVMPVTFSRPRGAGGFYDVDLHAASGFAHTSDGMSLPFGDWSRPADRWHLMFWWPSRNRADKEAAELRARLAGHDVYAYGGATLRCGPMARAYEAGVPLRLRAIERERGRVAMLWPGAHGGNDLAPRFLAMEPLRLVFATPSAPSLSYGGSIDGDDCPAIVVADWQVDLTVSLEPPRDGLRHGGQPYPQIHIGMTREEVAWVVGYPTEFAKLTALGSEKKWRYNVGPRGSFDVTFRNDRVESFTTPAGF